jgi:isopentenyl diphosphate isomerase/L-lactate dehydrogenase-like FMN-dependent dehydrogenase
MTTFRFRLTSDVPPLCVEDWRALARRRVPDLAWSYLDGGAEDRVTLSANRSGFGNWRLRQKMLTGLVTPDLGTTIAGTALSLPVALAPVGATGLAHWTGDVAAARAAESCGTRATLSTASSYSLEEVGAATSENHWFQLYPLGGRERMAWLMNRARDAGFDALFVTVDVPVRGNREDEARWSFALPWTVTPRRALHMARHARWVWQALHHKRLSSPHYLEAAALAAADSARARGLTSGIADAVASKESLAALMKPDLDWDDIAWMRDTWKGRFYVKGLLDADDAARAVDAIGADGVVVSNHGGRQLDHTLASIDALPAIATRLGGRGDVYLDGGVRRGTDVVKALCLGARGVFIGRPFVYGLAAGGEQGVRSVLEIFRAEIARTLVLMGCPSVSQLDRSWLVEGARGAAPDS